MDKDNSMVGQKGNKRDGKWGGGGGGHDVATYM